MLEFTQFDYSEKETDYTVTLTYGQRQKSRQRLKFDCGMEAALILPRGTHLHQGDRIAAADGTTVLVKAADESISVVSCSDALLFARACYHLGNRHQPLQIEEGKLSYLHDHVLDDMIKGFGLQVDLKKGPFEPEEGAYGGESGHSHKSHSHD